jgi:hypothetical protein
MFARTTARPIALAALFAALSWIQAGQAAERPTVVELFTSQGCYSCPPAEAFLRELAKRPDIIALEFHVDYWDELVYGAAGKWKDPFSSPMATARQRQYAAVFGTGRVYTPQMVVDGRTEGVGSHRSEINAAIAAASAKAEEAVGISVAAGEDGSLGIAVDGPSVGKATLWLVQFDRSHTTEVLAGENKGKRLSSSNVVRELRRLADWTGGRLEISVEARQLDAADSCAVLLQSPRQGPILQAAHCPPALL